MRFQAKDKIRPLAAPVLSLLLLVIFLAVSIAPAPKRPPRAVAGTLDLTGWDLAKDGPVRLDGEWEFYWRRLLTRDDLRAVNRPSAGYIRVPMVWNHHRLNGASLPGFGFATYRLRVKTADPETAMGLKLATMSTSYRLMVDGTTVAENGKVARDPAAAVPEYRPRTVFFKAASEFEILVQVANFTYARGGIWYSIHLGTERQIAALKESTRGRELFLLGALIIMALYHAGLYLLGRKLGFKAELYFAFMLLLVAARIFCTGEYFILNPFPSISLKWLVFLDYVTVSLAPVAFGGFIRELYPAETLPHVSRAVIGAAALMTVLAAVTPIAFFTRFTLLVEIFVGLAALYFTAATILAAARRRPGAVLFCGGLLCFISVFIYDCLYNWNIITGNYNGLFPLAGFVFIFIQAFILAKRFRTAFSEREALSARLISLDKLKDDFLANTSHELRMPLLGMTSMAQSILENAAGHLDQRQRESLALVVASGRRLANLVNDILDYSQLKHGDIQIVKKSVDLRQVVAAVLEVSRHLAAAKPIALISAIPDDLPALYADENRLAQIIYNLVGNAVKFTERGRIEISAAQKDGFIEISVADTGIGIPGERLDHIFESFEQIGELAAGEIGGTGLGLSITKYLVEIHGGRIWASSVPGQGSTFTFSMPVCADQSQAGLLPGRESQADRQAESRPQFSTPAVYGPPDGAFTILLVDDDYLNLQALVNALSAEGFKLIAVADGNEALETIEGNREIDLIVLDVMLPGISGYEICRRIRREHSLSELPVLMLTARNSPPEILEGFEAGANDYLAKPFEVTTLRARVNTLLQLKKSVAHAIQAEMAYLQAQIKPHFLYNALNTIAAFCWTDPEKAGELLLELSNYLRGGFHFGNMEQFITLERELEFVQSYLAIQKVRFEDRLICRFEIAGPLDLNLPTLVLQPLVENAVQHGILPKATGGTVAVRIRPQDDCTLIEVEDDGVGMSPDKLAACFAANNSEAGVGLMNIDKRMRRTYGYGLDIVSSVGQGTKVVVRIPK